MYFFLTRFFFTEFSALAGLHDKSRFPGGTLNHETVNVMQNILSMQEKQASQMVTPTSNMLILQSNTVLNASKVAQYITSGYSHVFVYSNSNKEGRDIIQDDYQILGSLDLKVRRDKPTFNR
jgi:CBS domain containing-hemolysin-like protein